MPLLSTFSQKTILTDAVIKTLPSLGADLLPAPGANKKIIVVDTEVYIDTTAGGYTVDANCRWQLFLGSKEITGLAQPELALSTTPGKYSLKFPPFCAVGTDGDAGYMITSPKDFDVMVNQPLRIKDDYNGVADYTGGNAANSVEIVVTYAIIEV